MILHDERKRQRLTSGDKDDDSVRITRNMYDQQCSTTGEERDLHSDFMDNELSILRSENSTMLPSSSVNQSTEANIRQNCDDEDSSNLNQSMITVLESPIQEEVAIDHWKQHVDEYKARRSYVIGERCKEPLRQ